MNRFLTAASAAFCSSVFAQHQLPPLTVSGEATTPLHLAAQQSDLADSLRGIPDVSLASISTASVDLGPSSVIHGPGGIGGRIRLDSGLVWDPSKPAPVSASVTGGFASNG